MPSWIQEEVGNYVKKILRSLALALTLVLVTANGSLAKDAWALDNFPEPTMEADMAAGIQRVAITEDGQYVTVSGMYGQWQAEGGRDDFGLCTNIAKDDCAKKNLSRIFGTSLLPLCGEVVESCIKGLEVYKEGAAAEAAKLVKQIPGFRSDGEPGMGVPQGSGLSVFSAPNAPHTGGSEYTVMAAVSWEVRGAKTYIQQVRIKVSGTSEQANPQSRLNYPSVCTSPVGSSNAGQRTPCSGPGGPACVYQLDGFCGKEQDLAPDTRIKLSLQVSNQLTGWFQGRLKDPSVDITPIDSRYNTLSIDAAAVTVPRLFVKYDTKKFGNALDGVQYGTYGLDIKVIDASENSTRDVIRKLTLADNDTATATSTLWTVSTLNSGGNACLADTSKVVGIVTTNAMAYLGSAPDFKNGTLSYQVAGTHYLPDGTTLSEGTYDLVMRSETARCLYGFSKAPISATISVVSDKGENKVATTVISEKNGWLKLAAYGFTFSSPTISVKLSQAKAPAAKKTTITCVKGKLTKKVTAVSPKCPAGYKKK